MQFVGGKPRYFATTVLCVLLIWPTEPFLTNAFLMCLTKCIHFMQLADLVVASKIVNGKYQHFYISFLVQVFNNREIANNSCVKGKSSINECSLLHHKEWEKPKTQTGKFPQIATRCFCEQSVCHSELVRRNLRGVTVHSYLVHIWDHIRKGRVCL